MHTVFNHKNIGAFAEVHVLVKWGFFQWNQHL